ncbi:hypothetical protein [Denitromonas halophila]|nr:hypothetical protein [Denitromonas halophila]
MLDLPEAEVHALLAALPQGVTLPSLGAAVAAASPGVSRKRFINPRKVRS